MLPELAATLDTTAAIIPDRPLTVPSALDTAAIICGALTGAMAATRKGLDWVGVLIIAYCTGVGGGIVRDILLQNGPPALLLNPSYQLYATTGAIAGLFFAKGVSKLTPLYTALDTFMLGVWVLLACSKAQVIGLGIVPTIFVGTIAAVGGSMLRDVLIHEIPAIVQPGYWYAICAFFAAVTFTLLEEWLVPLPLCQIVAIAVAAGLRIISLRFHLKSPTPYDLTRGLRIRGRLITEPDDQLPQSWRIR